MRKLARQIAHENMKREGIQHPNRRYRELNGRSFFARHWRKYVYVTRR